MRPHNRLNPDSQGHTGTRSVLRIAGPCLLLTGLLLVGSGAFEIVAGDPFRNPGSMFVRMFVGMPLLFVGVVTTKLAFLGVFLRYGANEVAPVGRDAVNYMVDGTRDSLRDAATAVAGGLREGFNGVPGGGAASCGACGHANDADARFCEACGKPLQSPATCHSCGTANDAEAKFCDHCGAALGKA